MRRLLLVLLFLPIFCKAQLGLLHAGTIRYQYYASALRTASTTPNAQDISAFKHFFIRIANTIYDAGNSYTRVVDSIPELYLYYGKNSSASGVNAANTFSFAAVFVNSVSPVLYTDTGVVFQSGCYQNSQFNPTANGAIARFGTYAYVRNERGSISNIVDYGVTDVSGNSWYIELKNIATNISGSLFSGATNSNFLSNSSNVGRWFVQRLDNSNIDIDKNGLVLSHGAITRSFVGFPNANIYISAYNNNGTASNFAQSNLGAFALFNGVFSQTIRSQFDNAIEGLFDNTRINSLTTGR